MTAAYRHGNGLLVGFGGGAGNLYASGNVGIGTTSPGTIIGKALEPIEKGSGRILVLLSLQ